MYDSQKNYDSSEETFLVENGNLDHLIKNNKQYVEKIVLYLTKNSKHADNDDLVQEGFIALIEAAKSFSVEKNTRFSTHVYNRIKWKLYDYYKKPFNKPRNKKYVAFNEDPEERESQNTQEYKHKRKLIKLPEKEIPCDEEDERQREDNNQKEYVESAIDKLQDDERLIIRARFYEEKKETLEEIGKCLGISKEGVRKKEAKAIEKLKFILRKDYIYG